MCMYMKNEITKNKNNNTNYSRHRAENIYEIKIIESERYVRIKIYLWNTNGREKSCVCLCMSVVV